MTSFFINALLRTRVLFLVNMLGFKNNNSFIFLIFNKIKENGHFKMPDTLYVLTETVYPGVIF
jgi:hypothetical protein